MMMYTVCIVSWRSSELTWVAIPASPGSARSPPPHPQTEEGQGAAKSLGTASPDSPTAATEDLLVGCKL